MRVTENKCSVGRLQRWALCLLYDSYPIYLMSDLGEAIFRRKFNNVPKKFQNTSVNGGIEQKQFRAEIALHAANSLDWVPSKRYRIQLAVKWGRLRSLTLHLPGILLIYTSRWRSGAQFHIHLIQCRWLVITKMHFKLKFGWHYLIGVWDV